jgi:leucyl/phenylalanyl-tRNA--protein transferase
VPLFWLDPSEPPAFPPLKKADIGGLLAVGGDITPEWLAAAYRHGAFPWFEHDGEFYWYSPDPRCVLFPAELQVHKSMRSIFNQHKFRFTLDTCFEEVMRACADRVREGHPSTWITPRFVEGYTEMYRLGIGHSVEVWQGDELVGGLYGLAFGRIFCGESMFARTTNASKAGFITLVRALQKQGFTLIDCQQETEHLLSLGARSIPRTEFAAYLSENQYQRTLLGRWRFDADMNLDVVEIKP